MEKPHTKLRPNIVTPRPPIEHRFEYRARRSAGEKCDP